MLEPPLADLFACLVAHRRKPTRRGQLAAPVIHNAGRGRLELSTVFPYAVLPMVVFGGAPGGVVAVRFDATARRRGPVAPTTREP